MPEYKVVWKREGQRQKTKIYQTREGALARQTLLGPEPWKYVGRDPDELFCCDGLSGSECGCGGVTVREHWLEAREDIPPIEILRVEWRSVGVWDGLHA